MSSPYELCMKLQDTVSKTIYGNDTTIRSLTTALLVGGHVLLEGPPGVAKTKLAKTFAAASGLEFSRVQFTPDLMPSDVTGMNIFDQSTSQFRLSAGPIFTQVLLADEINRTPPKTQAALLEAMQERNVTIDGHTHELGDMFFVIATQNPIEHEGTYPLPEAQLDRFLFKLRVGYPSEDHEFNLVKELSASTDNIQAEDTTYQVISIEEIRDCRRLVRNIRAEDSIIRYAQNIIAQTRNNPQLLLGASPRAAIYLLLAAKVNAAIEQRDFIIPDDIKAVASNTLGHRLIPSPESFMGEEGPEEVLGKILDSVPLPSSAV